MKRIMDELLIDMINHTTGTTKHVATYFNIPESDVYTLRKGEIPARFGKAYSDKYYDRRNGFDQKDDLTRVRLRRKGHNVTKHIHNPAGHQVTRADFQNILNEAKRNNIRLNTALDTTPLNMKDFIADHQPIKTVIDAQSILDEQWPDELL